MRSAPPQGVVCPDIRADGEIGPWLRSHDDLWEARRASDMPIATEHRPAIARTPKSPTFLPYSTVPVTQPPAVSLNLGTVYEYRSRALHAGTPFPGPMLLSPYMVLGGVILPELPHGGGAVSSSGGTWTAKDLPVSLHTFHYITRNALLKWWDSELAIGNNSP